ncbi:site-specific integrase [Kribbella sp. NBC_01484]|uniref:tyrosine-type recombinase/integrase n=1 Tax=Kribbella sp. NBC_01484 TaxID=2903579 RepID=UPI002E315B08|nr:site-specific integrase [Kribbella sp. NBC_01484]
MRRVGVRLLLEHLEQYDGDTWTDRWKSGGFDGGGRPIADIGGAAGGKSTRRMRIASGFRSLVCLRVIQPTLVALRSNKVVDLAHALQVAENDPLLDRFVAEVNRIGRSYSLRKAALYDVACMLLSQRIALRDVTPEALLHFSIDSARYRSAVVKAGTPGRHRGRLVWDVLHGMGHFPPGAPHSLQACLNGATLSAAELVDRHELRNRGVRDLLVDYLSRRQPEVDYTTLTGLAYNLAAVFWKAVVQINPGQRDLRLGQDTYAQWRAGLNVCADGRVRRHPEDVLSLVRSFYLDLQSWAIEEPERWAHWVVPCPISPVDVRGERARKRRVNEKITDRIRVRKPLLPILVDHLEQRRTELGELLDLAGRTALGQAFTHRGRRYRRTGTSYDQQLVAAGQPTVRVVDEATGRITSLTLEEDPAFWLWACVETMRHTGVRIEELLELTQLSIRQFERPGGELIGLLVIAPSKTDRERVVPMSAELLHVLAAVILRLTAGGRPIRLVRRYDPYERVWSPPMPFLFQRSISGDGVMGAATVREMLQRACADLAATHRAFVGVTFTPHNFRRLFATELVNNGLPIHIGAKLLGHLDLQTTQGYVAVFEEDMVQHYQDFLARRRELRPADEYIYVTPREWTDFEEHFDKRKVELGSCARPYGTPCQHEHACVRCPMLHVDPRMLPRLQELEDDLMVRRRRAVDEGWLGEIEGIDLTLRLLREKQAGADKLTRRTVELGMPGLRPS